MKRRSDVGPPHWLAGAVRLRTLGINMASLQSRRLRIAAYCIAGVEFALPHRQSSLCAVGDLGIGPKDLAHLCDGGSLV